MKHENYPNCEEICSVEKGIVFLPETLSLLLQTLFCGKDTVTKVASIGQAIMQAVDQELLLPPLQIGLGVQMHRHFGSRFWIESLYQHGFCSSYSEIQKYERSAAVNQGTELPGFLPGSFIQHMADNADHNVRTIDGFNTFHGMGIITTVTPEIQLICLYLEQQLHQTTYLLLVQ